MEGQLHCRKSVLSVMIRRIVIGTLYARRYGVRSVKMERRASNGDDFCTRSDPVLIVPCTPYLLLDRVASGL
jgi:hypothetical protein